MADDPRDPGVSSSNFASTKIGPLPAWAWLAGTIGVAFVWFYLRRNKSDSDAPPVTNTVTVPGVDSADVQGQLATLNAQIRDLQGNGSVPTPGGDSEGDLTGTFSNIPRAHTPDPGTPHTTGPLRSGASLANLATLYWGDPNGANWLYWVNEKVIEDAAKNAGYPDSQDGTILVPGIDLLVPPKLKGSPDPQRGTVNPT